jgi:hypothetical protein
MTTYSYTVTFNDSEHIYLEQLLNEKIKQCKEAEGESDVKFYTDILYRLNSAKIELRSYTDFDEDGIPTIKLDLTKL